MNRLSFVLMAAAFAAYGQKIETQKTDRTRIVRIETALNHLTVIELGDPVEQVAAGSTSYKVEWRGNKVFVEPLEANAETNLFIWTRSGARLNYELAPAGSIENMHFAIDQEPTLTASVVIPPPAPREAAPATAAIPVEMLQKSIPVQFTGPPSTKQRISVQVRDVYEKDGKVYLRYSIRNIAGAAYEPGDPSVYRLQGTRAPVSLVGMRRTQLAGATANRLIAESKEEVTLLHVETETDVVDGGSQTVGLLAFERPQASGPVVLRLSFAADRNQEVSATLVL
jgi:hypothetical protein